MNTKNRFGGDEIRIRKVMLQQTGTFHDVYNRSFEMRLDDGAIDSVRRRLEGVGRGSLTRQSFRGLASGILVPAGEVNRNRDLIEIPDGWDRARCRFMMEVEVKTRLGDDSVYFFQGFTDNLGLGRTGSVDPKMVFYINGFIRASYVTRRDERGTYEVAVVKESAQVIDGQLVFDRDQETYKARTVDLYSSIQERFYDNGFTEKLDDSRTTLESPVDSIFARRIDNLPGEYLSSSLETYRRNLDILSFGTDRGDVLNRTQQTLNSEVTMIEDNPILRRLAQIQGVHSSTRFTMENLIDLDPDVTDNGIIEGVNLDQKAQAQLAHHSGDVSDWRGSTQEARWATQLSNAIAAVMMGSYFRKLDFMADNLNIEHNIMIIPQDSMAVASSMPEQIFERMIDQIEDILFDISGGNIDDFSLQIQANLYDQTEIWISINGEPEQHFFVPQFADSLMSPFYTRDRSRLSNLSSDLELLLNDLSGEIAGSSSALSSAAGV